MHDGNSAPSQYPSYKARPNTTERAPSSRTGTRRGCCVPVEDRGWGGAGGPNPTRCCRRTSPPGPPGRKKWSPSEHNLWSTSRSGSGSRSRGRLSRARGCFATSVGVEVAFRGRGRGRLVEVEVEGRGRKAGVEVGWSKVEVVLGVAVVLGIAQACKPTAPTLKLRLPTRISDSDLGLGPPTPIRTSDSDLRLRLGRRSQNPKPQKCLSSEEGGVWSRMMNCTRRFLAFMAGVTFGTSGLSWP